jgi:hypothetical protein
MKAVISLLVAIPMLITCAGAFGASLAVNGERSFDSDWCFLRADAPVSGVGELAATGSPAPNDDSSFRLPIRKTYQGRCLAILRPQGDAGKITLKAEADGVKAATVVVLTQ